MLWFSVFVHLFQPAVFLCHLLCSYHSFIIPTPRIPLTPSKFPLRGFQTDCVCLLQITLCEKILSSICVTPWYHIVSLSECVVNWNPNMEIKSVLWEQAHAIHLHCSYFDFFDIYFCIYWLVLFPVFFIGANSNAYTVQTYTVQT